MKYGNIFNIQRFSIHDGPGIRTTVFLKGCNLRCEWCHNPESQSPKPEIQYFPQKCIACGQCVGACQNSAHKVADRLHSFDRTLCQGCGSCAGGCYAEALLLTGKRRSADDIFKEVSRDAPFYASDGGATFSGGEPLLQSGFVAECAALCKSAGLTVAVDTAGCVEFSAFEEALPYCDLFLFDIKHCNEEMHKAATGVGISLIRANLVRLLSLGIRIWIRIPLIPRFNDSDEDMTAIAAYIADIYKEAGSRAEQIELMPFHRTASGKYASLGRVYSCDEIEPPPKEQTDRLNKIIMNIL